MPPALLTRTSRRPQRSWMARAQASTEARSARSSRITWTRSLPERCFTSAAAASAFSSLRQARTVVAPMEASPTAVSLPMPMLDPVITTTLPFTLSPVGLTRASSGHSPLAARGPARGGAERSLDHGGHVGAEEGGRVGADLDQGHQQRQDDGHQTVGDLLGVDVDPDLPGQLVGPDALAAGLAQLLEGGDGEEPDGEVGLEAGQDPAGQGVAADGVEQ